MNNIKQLLKIGGLNNFPNVRTDAFTLFMYIAYHIYSFYLCFLCHYDTTYKERETHKICEFVTDNEIIIG